MLVLQVRTLKAAAISKDKALAKGAADLAQQHERAVKAERTCSLSLFYPILHPTVVSCWKRTDLSLQHQIRSLHICLFCDLT